MDRELSRLPASAQATPVVVLTALAAVTIPAAAQSPTSFPWYMKGARDGTSSHFRSYKDYRATVSGLAAGVFATRVTAVRIANKPGMPRPRAEALAGARPRVWV
jgi:hypothetical protein